MSGVRNGVQALLKKEADGHGLYVHCFARSLNLCIKDVTQKCELLRNFMDFIFQLVQLIRFSPKRLNLFESVRKDISVSEGESGLSPSLRPLCLTRWTVCHSAIASILKNYKILMTTLEIVRQGHDEYAAKGSGLLAKMESFETFFSLKLACRVLSAAEQFSINLQAEHNCFEGTRGADLLRSHYVSLRSYTAFTDFYKDVLHSSGGLTDETVLPRCLKVPRRYDEGGETHRYASPEHRYRHAYFEVLDYAIGEIVRRLDQSDLAIVFVRWSLC